MQIWVDADAAPKLIKDIIYRAANRTQTVVTFVSNHALQTPASPFIKKLQVLGGFDVADNAIIQNMQPGDLVITADIPLADAVISKNGTALNPRGQLYSKQNIKQRLAMRNFNEELRSSGMIRGGPQKLDKSAIQAFANCLDQFLASR